MTNEERIIELLEEQNKILQQQARITQRLLEQFGPKYETKIGMTGKLHGNDLVLVTKDSNNEKAEEA